MQLVHRGATAESLELERPRTVGVEHVGLWAMREAGSGEIAGGLGFNGRHRGVGPSLRAQPLLEVAPSRPSLMRLYRVSEWRIGRPEKARSSPTYLWYGEDPGLLDGSVAVLLAWEWPGHWW